MRRLISAMWAVSWLVNNPSIVLSATLQTDDFQMDLSGWTSGGSLVSLESTGGPEGTNDGFLRLQSSFGNFATHNSTPAWTGDFTAIGAARVTADMMGVNGSESLSLRLVLFGPGNNPMTSPRWTSTVSVEVPPDGIWRNYTFSLAESDLTRVLGADSYQNLMQNVLRVMLRHDPDTPDAGGTPVAGDLGIDNIALSDGALAGDFNLDGVVNGADFLAWQRGNSPTSLSAGDLMDWQTNYGAPLLTIPYRAVPEPALGLFCSLWLFLVGRRFF